MIQQRSKFEIYLELLTQVKHGNHYKDTLMNCTNLPQREFDQLVDPLLSERLLEKVKINEGQENRSSYRLTQKGDQFIDFLTLSMYFSELENQNISETKQDSK